MSQHIDPAKIERAFRESMAKARADMPTDLSPTDRQYTEMQFELDELFFPLTLWHVRGTNHHRNPGLMAQAVAEKIALTIVNYASNMGPHGDDIGSVEQLRLTKALLEHIAIEAMVLCTGAGTRDMFSEEFEIFSEEGGHG